jgi:transcriptional regulator with XRE-family HTH domain
MRPLAEWERTNPGTVHDPEWFRRDVLPRLAGVKLAEIAEATGLSKSYASQIRAGKFTPHVSTWAALAELAGVDVLEPTASSDDSSPMEAATR